MYGESKYTGSISVEIDELLEVDGLGGRRDERLELVGVDDDVAALRLTS